MDEGLILGRYRLLTELGEGGHGTVDLAFDTKMARRVAIKRIPITHRGVALLEATTGLKEARTAALLNHPNIITVHEWDTDSDEAFLIMEHVDGASLAELLDAYGPFRADEAAAILGPVAEALAFAHDNGVLHLDLKPENVLVTRDGLVKVADFGVASLTNAAGQAISAGGTLGYMPPEQLRGLPVDPRTDIWALGALTFEVLTGAVPLASDSIEGALYKAERVEIAPPGEFEPSLPREIDDLVMAALEPDPESRPADVSEFADAVLALLGDPEEGRSALRDLVDEFTAEEEPDDAEGISLLRLGLWDRLATRSGAAERALTALGSAYLAWIGLEPLGFGLPASLGAVAIAAAGGWFAPPLGLAAGLVLLAAGGFAAGPVAGIALGLAGAVWWIVVCRVRPGAGAAPGFAPLAGISGTGAALPLLVGFFVDGVWAAGAAGAVSGLALALFEQGAAGAGANASPLALVFSPLSTLAVTDWGSAAVPVVATTLGWGVAGVLSSLGAGRGTRAGAAAGTAGGLLVMAAATGPWMTGGSQLPVMTVVRLAIALILMVAVIALGPPLQSGESADD
ncbi:MAG: serine/threonine-protein kinase [Coriobacteriia bacterium]|nr:serine/threonine-protein kinase [Coriobacteriia bacterium]